MSGVFPDGTTLDAVVDAMAGRRFDDDDGVRYFHEVYTEVTRAVARRVATGGSKTRRSWSRSTSRSPDSTWRRSMRRRPRRARGAFCSTAGGTGSPRSASRSPG